MTKGEDMNSNIRPRLRRTAALIIALGAAGSLSAVVGHAQAAGEKGAEAKRINDATAVLAKFVTAPDNGIPRAILQMAEAIVVFPYGGESPVVSGQGPNQIRGARAMGIRA